MTILERFREEFRKIAQREDLLSEEIQVEIKPLTAKQAIGLPERGDFPLQKGKERIIEASFKGSKGQAFTDAFGEYQGRVADLLELDLSDPFNAPVFVASANAVLRHLGLVEGTVHCRDQEPGQCATKLVDYLRANHPAAKSVALVGLQPALAEALVPAYELGIADLDPDNIGQKTAGALVRDGRRELERVTASADLVLATGSTLCNRSMDSIVAAAGGKPVVFFGISVAGAAKLLDLERYCPLGR